MVGGPNGRVFVTMGEKRGNLNGVGTGLTSGGFLSYTPPFTLNSGFVPGVNTLDFLVNNAGDAPNPTGLRAELSATADTGPTGRLFWRIRAC